MEPGAIGRRRRRGGAFSIARLFANGEAGGVYDPAQLTAEKVAWRRNLLTWSEDFTNAAWTKTRSSITPNAGTSWDGTATASKLVEDTTASNTHLLSATYASFVSGLSYTATFYAKAAERSVISVRGSTSRYFPDVTFDLSAGTATVVSGSGSIEPAGSGWYRCRVTATATSDGSSAIQVNLALANGSIIYTGDGTSGVLIDSSQFELGSTATAYQRITDFTSDFLAAFPTHSLYQNVAGTTPVTALGQPVALALDTKTGGLANLGTELFNIASLPTPSVINFGGSSGAWTAGTRTMSNTVTGTDNSYPRFSFGSAGITVNARYLVRGRLSGNLALVNRIRLAGAGVANDIAFNATTGVFYGVQVAGTTYIEFNLNGTLTAPQSVVIEELSVREVPGVHAIQASDPSRPLLDARVNLLVSTEDFTSASWTLNNPGTRTANTDVAPDGTTTADTITDNITGNYSSVRQAITVQNGTQSYVNSAHFKKTTGAASFPGVSMVLSGGTSKAASVAINTDTGVATARTGEVPDSIEVRDAGTFWRLLWTISNNGTGNTTLTTDIYAAVNTNGGATWAATTQGSAVIWGADLRLAADAAYPYQRVTAATDYADVGVPRAFLFDGMDDSLYTASTMDLSGTDKVTVLAGVRKLSDAATGMLAETSAVATSNNGCWLITAPDSVSNRYGVAVRGTNAVVLTTTAAAFTAPVTNVLTLIGNIAAPETTLRANGAVAVTNAGSLGTGNFSSQVLYVGRRNNASFPFNGKLYQLIVRGALTDAATLAQAERYVGARTGVFL